MIFMQLQTVNDISATKSMFCLHVFTSIIVICHSHSHFLMLHHITAQTREQEKVKFMLWLCIIYPVYLKNDNFDSWSCKFVKELSKNLVNFLILYVKKNKSKWIWIRCTIQGIAILEWYRTVPSILCAWNFILWKVDLSLC